MNEKVKVMQKNKQCLQSQLKIMRQLGMDNQEAHVTLSRRNRTETSKLITHNTEYQDDEQHCSQQNQGG